MARPKKTGLDYFSADVNIFRDRKIKRLMRKHNGAGFTVYFYLLTTIYSEEGYFYEWDNHSAFDVSDDLNLEENQVEQIVNYCLQVGLFSQSKFDNFSILTSKAIQLRWQKIVVDAKRSVTEINPNFELITEETLESSEETPKTPEETPETRKESTQSKVKDSKVKERIVKESKIRSPDLRLRDDGYLEKIPDDVYIPQRNDFIDYCLVCRYSRDFSEMLFDHLLSKGFDVGSGVIKDWKAYVRTKKKWNAEFNTQKKGKNGSNTSNSQFHEFAEALDELDDINTIG